jgi:hypothetical protein
MPKINDVNHLILLTFPPSFSPLSDFRIPTSHFQSSPFPNPFPLLLYALCPMRFAFPPSFPSHLLTFFLFPFSFCLLSFVFHNPKSAI